MSHRQNTSEDGTQDSYWGPEDLVSPEAVDRMLDDWLGGVKTETDTDTDNEAHSPAPIQTSGVGSTQGASQTQSAVSCVTYDESVAAVVAHWRELESERDGFTSDELKRAAERKKTVPPLNAEDARIARERTIKAFGKAARALSDQLNIQRREEGALHYTEKEKEARNKVIFSDKWTVQEKTALILRGRLETEKQLGLRD